jgi:hypothetical protein
MLIAQQGRNQNKFRRIQTFDDIITFRNLCFPLKTQSALNASREIYFGCGHTRSRKRLKNLRLSACDAQAGTAIF